MFTLLWYVVLHICGDIDFKVVAYAGIISATTVCVLGPHFALPVEASRVEHDA